MITESAVNRGIATPFIKAERTPANNSFNIFQFTKRNGDEIVFQKVERGVESAVDRLAAFLLSAPKRSGPKGLPKAMFHSRLTIRD